MGKAFDRALKKSDVFGELRRGVAAINQEILESRCDGHEYIAA